MTEDEIYPLLLKSFSEKLEETEEKKLNAWLNQSPENQNVLNELQQIWSSDLDNDVFPSPDEKHFQEQEEILLTRLSQLQKEEARQTKSAVLYRSVAIIALFIIALSSLVAYVVQVRLAHSGSISVDDNHTLILDDSTRVALNKNSHLNYSQSSSQRKVIFQGEGLFNVKRDESRPFTICLPIGTIKVLGTSFFVRAHSADTSAVWVTSGSVEVTNSKQKIILTNGQKAIVTPAGEIISSSFANDPNFNSWYTRKFQFDKTKLKKIITLLSDEYNATIKVSNPNLMSCRFTGTFEDESLENILNILAQTMDFTFSFQDGIYLINGPGCTN